MSKDKHQGWMLLLADALQAATLFGLLSGTAAAIAFGKILLAILLGGITFRVFLRFKRRRNKPGT
jgi:hypothetical protein